jgi:predicted transcriptional regulator with HTH domain
MPSFMELTKSELRRKLLAYFFTNTESRLYLREMALIIKEDPGNLSKELSNLVKEGLFNVEECGSQKYFSLNKSYPLYKELESIVNKTVGFEGAIKKALSGINGILFAFIYGSFASERQNTSSDIDLVIIGDIDEQKLLLAVSELQKFLNREINYTLYSKKDWNKVKKDKGSFTANIYNEPKIMLIGGKNEL